MRTTARRLLPPILVATLLLASPALSTAWAVDDAVIVDPLPTEDLFVDPVRDMLDPALAAVDPREAEIEPWRLDVRPSEVPLQASRSRVLIGTAPATSSLFIDPTSRENELTDVERVAAGRGEVRVGRLDRRVSSDRLAATRRARFGRPAIPAPRPPFDPSRPFGPRP